MAEQDERIRKENEKYCHECGELIRLRAEICPKCRARQPLFRPVHATSPGQKFCHECGEIIDGKAEICPKCGVRQPSYLNIDTIAGNVLGQGQPRSRVAAGLLAILGGGLGLHRFYLGQPVWGVVYILLIWTGIPVLLGLIEGICFLIMHEDEFQRRYAGPAWSSRKV